MEEQLQLIIKKNLPNIPTLPTSLSSKEGFISYLSPYFQKLLNNDFAALLQIMYRIDVSEKEFALTLHPSSKKDPEIAIAELIYDRLMLKVKIRAKYKNKDA
ncbi:MAG: hypothetical protein ACJAT1_000405 [Marivirga sp.]|jgi:hypothetical protein